MAFHLQHRGLVFPKVIAAAGVLTLVAGSVLVFFIHPSGQSREKPSVSLTTPTSSVPSESTTKPTKSSLKPTKKSSKSSSSSLKKPTPRTSAPVATSAPATSSPKPTGLATPTTKKPSPTPTATPKPKPSMTPAPTPTPTPAPTATASTPPPAYSALRAQVIFLINQKRTEAGVSQLASNSHLSDQCQTWSASMSSRNVLEHSSMAYGGEIIASGPSTAEAVVDLWMNSPDHRQILLDDRYEIIGSGYVNGYWTVQFG